MVVIGMEMDPPRVEIHELHIKKTVRKKALKIEIRADHTPGCHPVTSYIKIVFRPGDSFPRGYLAVICQQLAFRLNP